MSVSILSAIWVGDLAERSHVQDGGLRNGVLWYDLLDAPAAPILR